MSHHVFGIRHHGPGSARSLERALQALEPDAVLIEGPPEADGLLELAVHDEMEPPVALLAYVPDDPGRASFFPFAEFSPEWVAIRHAVHASLPVSFCDLPAANNLADGGRGRRRRVETDPLAVLAEAAGHGDAERWWEDMVEQRRDELDAFAAIEEAMGAVREETLGAVSATETPREAQREAYMRQTIRKAIKAGHERIAVVCGAWHAPALATLGPAAPDAKTLKGLPKVKVQATWVPWTYALLARESGYGAGVDSPAWYEHLYGAEEAPIERWLAGAARLLREQGLDASAAQVVDAVRLADALAAVRGRPLAGLAELTDAVLAALCGGSNVPLKLIRERLVVGERIGAVPEETPQVPLQRDLARLQKSLRMKPAAGDKELDLDLRREIDRNRSRLLHRLGLLGVDWGQPVEVRGSLGTFRERWVLAWRPSLALDLIEAGRHGTTVESAAASAAAERAGSEDADLASLATLASDVLLADLPDSLPPVLAALDARAALGRDLSELMDALPPLAGVSRYGDVRGSDVEAVAGIVEGLVLRVCVGLRAAATGLDDESAREFVARVDAVNGALATMDDPELKAPWHEALTSLAMSETLPGLIAGRTCRLLLDAERIDRDEVGDVMSRALSPAADHSRGASWVEGFLAGSGLVLLHDPQLLGLIDGWLVRIGDEPFTNVLPLLRRGFSEFAPTERRQIGERLRDKARVKGEGPLSPDAGEPYDERRAAPALATLQRILG